MQVSVTADSEIEGIRDVDLYVRDIVYAALHRFADSITRIEVRIRDDNNSAWEREADRRIVMEAWLLGARHLRVLIVAGTAEQGVKGAAKRLAKLLDKEMNRFGNVRNPPPPSQIEAH